MTPGRLARSATESANYCTTAAPSSAVESCQWSACDPNSPCCSSAATCITWPARWPLTLHKSRRLCLLERSAAILFGEQMEHRRFLAHPEVHRPFVGGD